VHLPTVSVVLPVRNAARYVRGAVESVLGQTLRDLEVLLMDDGSTDQSLEILSELALRDSRCRVIASPSRGIAATLNDGISRAAGELIARMDADDICWPERLAKQVDYLAQHPECVAIGCRIRLIDPEGMSIREMGDKFFHNDIDKANIQGYASFITHPTVVMRKEALLRVGGYCEDFIYAQDLDLFLRLAEVGQLACLPEVLLDYRQHTDSIAFKYSTTQVSFAREAVLRAHSRRGMPPPDMASAGLPVSPISTAAVHRKWAWWALGAGNLATARKHAAQALRREPMSPASWRLVACVVRGY
jgi:glycosyltransferase involved in cell wall biosynthesis